jgi:hypothetical protein
MNERIFEKFRRSGDTTSVIYSDSL